MEFKAALDSLREMIDYIRQQAESHNVEQSLILKMELASEEAIVNIISYAYKNQKGNISINCERNGQRFEIILRDQGVPFNPIDVEINPQLNTPVIERKVGGMGIFLIRKIIDEVSYQREEDENILRMVFNLF